MDNQLKKFYNDRSQRELSLSESSKQRVKENIFANLGTQLEAEEPGSLWNKFRSMFLRGYVLVPLVVLLFIAGTGMASANALPGDPLYSVKRKIEDTRVLMAPTERAKVELQVNFAEKRLDELEKIQSAKRATKPTDEPVKDDQSPAEEVRNGSTDNNDTDQDRKRWDDNTRDQNDGDRNSSEDRRRDRAREQAKDAYQFLQKVQKDWEKEDSQQSRQLNERVEKFRVRLDNDQEDSNFFRNNHESSRWDGHG